MARNLKNLINNKLFNKNGGAGFYDWRKKGILEGFFDQKTFWDDACRHFIHVVESVEETDSKGNKFIKKVIKKKSFICPEFGINPKTDIFEHLHMNKCPICNYLRLLKNSDINEDEIVVSIGKGIEGIEPINITRGAMLRENNAPGWRDSWRWQQETFFGFIPTNVEGEKKKQVLQCNKTMADIIRNEIENETKRLGEGREFNPFIDQNPLGFRMTYTREGKSKGKYTGNFDPRIQLTDDIKKLFEAPAIDLSNFTTSIGNEMIEYLAKLIDSYRVDSLKTGTSITDNKVEETKIEPNVQPQAQTQPHTQQVNQQSQVQQNQTVSQPSKVVEEDNKSDDIPF